jgi:hypothetical protein
MEHYAEVFTTNDIPSTDDYWGLIRRYGGSGLSDTSRDDALLGSFFRVRLFSERPLNLESLQADFPDISITQLEAV